jgi:hypothetical protein
VTLHQGETLESRLSFRSRVLDYIWAGLPVVATEGDAISELIAAYDLGALVAGGDADGVAAALLRLLDLPRAAFGVGQARARAALTWERAVEPLARFCRAPHRAADKEALGNGVGNPFYMGRLAALQQTIDGYERRRVIRWMRRHRQLRPGRF